MFFSLYLLAKSSRLLGTQWYSIWTLRLVKDAGQGSVLETLTGIQSQWQVLVYSLRKGRQAHRNLDLSQNRYFPRASADNPGRSDTISFLWWLPWEFCRQLAFLPRKLKTREVRGRQGCNKSPLLWPLWPWPGCSTHELETTILSFGTRAAARRIHQISPNGTRTGRPQNKGQLDFPILPLGTPQLGKHGSNFLLVPCSENA